MTIYRSRNALDPTGAIRDALVDLRGRLYHRHMYMTARDLDDMVRDVLKGRNMSVNDIATVTHQWAATCMGAQSITAMMGSGLRSPGSVVTYVEEAIKFMTKPRPH